MRKSALAVDRTDPVVPGHLTEPGAPLTTVAQLAVDEHLDGDHRQRLVAERSRPPQRRVGRGRCSIRGRSRHSPPPAWSRRAARPSISVRITIGRCASLSSRAVDAQVGAAGVGIAAQHAQSIDAHRPGVVEPHRAPQPARVERPVEPFRLLQHPGDVPAIADVALRRAGDLDGEDVFVVEPAEIGDVEAVREEVALRIAEIRPVEPHVALVEARRRR